jgi:hypothetical protein
MTCSILHKYINSRVFKYIIIIINPFCGGLNILILNNNYLDIRANSSKIAFTLLACIYAIHSVALNSLEIVDIAKPDTILMVGVDTFSYIYQNKKLVIDYKLNHTSSILILLQFKKSKYEIYMFEAQCDEAKRIRYQNGNFIQIDSNRIDNRYLPKGHRNKNSAMDSFRDFSFIDMKLIEKNTCSLNKEYLVLYFFYPKCYPCSKTSPFLNQLLVETDKFKLDFIAFARLESSEFLGYKNSYQNINWIHGTDLDGRSSDVIRAYGIEYYPTLLIFKNRKLYKKIVGAIDILSIKSLIVPKLL